jgi:hypothetical protein
MLPVDAINSKLLPQLSTINPNPSGPAGGAAQILQANPINYKSQLNSAKKKHNSSIFVGGAGKFHRRMQLMMGPSLFLSSASITLHVTP